MMLWNLSCSRDRIIDPAWSSLFQSSASIAPDAARQVAVDGDVEAAYPSDQWGPKPPWAFVTMGI
jgi:hypothetical protein